MSLDERTTTRDLSGTPGAGTGTGNLTIGQIAVGTIAGAGGPLGDHDLYVFRTQPGLVYRIETLPATWPSLTSTPNPLPYFVLRDTAGTVLDQAVLVDGRYVYQFTANAALTLYVDMQGYFTDSIGGYEVVLTSSGPDDVGGTFPTPLTAGVQFNGVLDQVGDSDTFSISLVAGRSYFLTLGSNTVTDLFVSVRNPLWLALSYADAGTGYSTSFTADTTGTYIVDVTSNALLQTGPYAIYYQERVNPALRFTAGSTDADTFTLTDGTTGREVWGWGGDDVVTTGATGDFLAGNDGNDTLNPGAGDDAVFGGAGNDRIDGGPGLDVAGYGRVRSAFTIERTGADWRVTDRVGAEGTDLLSNVEALRFSDKVLALVPPARDAAPAYGQQPAFLLDPVYYLLRYAELAPAVTPATAAQHWLDTGAAQGRAPNAWFDAGYYAQRWADLAPLNLDAATLFKHYNLYGVWEGRSAGPRFDTFDGDRYLADNPDVAAYVDGNLADFLGSRSNGAIAHYVIYGAQEQRAAFDASGTAIDLGYVV